MKPTDYDKLINVIDMKLNIGSFEFEFMDYKPENNIITGLKHIGYWKEAKAVARKEQMIIDSNGISHSIIKDELKFKQLKI